MESGGTSVALLMVRDAYANYVVQTALDVVPEGEEKRMLLEELTSHSAELVRTVVQDGSFGLLTLSHAVRFVLFFQRNYTFAKHIVTKLGA